MPPEDRLVDYEFGCVQRTEIWKPTPHRHDNVEMMFADRGWAVCLLGGRLNSIPPARMAVFWGARPHQWLEVEEGSTRTFIDIPLPWFLSWQLPKSFVQSIYGGEMPFEQSEDWSGIDRELVNRWTRDLENGDPALKRSALLEIEARLHRLALGVQTPASENDLSRWGRPPETRAELSKVVAMASYIAENHVSHLQVQGIADSVSLHPNYAMTLFHKETGFTLMEYLVGQRISHAQLLLATTEVKIVDVAFESGFGSISRFYTAFKRATGMTPSAYRRSMQSAHKNPRG